jgi:AcrR family transcriptional regulator
MYVYMLQSLYGCKKNLSFEWIFMIETQMQRTSETKSGKHRPKTQAERTAETRTRLIEAAEKIFARDGFQAAKLEEIASEAGYTRGALYANFEGKEELFIALIGHETERRMAAAQRVVSNLTSQSSSQTARYQALKAGYLRSMTNQTWNVLFIEFKLFVLRHPDLKAQVTEMQTKAFATVAKTLEQIFACSDSKPPVSPLAAGMALGALANTLGIDLMIGDALSEKEKEKLLNLFYDALTGNSMHRGG